MFKWYLDSQSDIAAAPLMKAMISAFDKLPAKSWLSGEAKDLFKKVDQEVDALLREKKMDHYTTRRHLDLNFMEKLNFELP